MKKIYLLLTLSLIVFLSGCGQSGAPASTSRESTSAPQASVAASSALSSSTLAAEYKKITPQEAKSLMETNPEAIILDVRTAEEFSSGHISGAVQMESAEFAQRAQAVLPDKDAMILVYCRTGRRSQAAAEELLAMGYRQVIDFGGIEDWPYETVTD